MMVMAGRPVVRGISAFLLAGVLGLNSGPVAAASGPATGTVAGFGGETPDPERGRYLFDLAGCASCHTDRENGGPLLGGGRALKTPFGTFYGPNISSHPEQGIGGWSDADFIRALRQGIGPDGTAYYPAFPYTSYTKMTDADMLAIKAHIDSLPASERPNRAHDIDFPFNMRQGLIAWKWLYFDEGVFTSSAGRPEPWNRGAYLVEAVAHCGECHTPRNFLGGLDRGRWLGGTTAGPDGDPVPNITPHKSAGIGNWSDFEIADSLETGALPDGDYVGAAMGEVVEFGTSGLTADDLDAIVVYLRSVQPVGGTSADPS